MTNENVASSDAASEAAGMLGLIDAQRRSTQSRLVRGYTWLLIVWAAAWAIGFGALWFAQDIGGVPVLPPVAAWIIFGASLATAIAWSITAGVRSAGSGIRGGSQLQGAMYGWSWTISMVAAWLLIVGLQRAGLSQDLASLLYPGLFVMLVGVLYLAGGALWRSPVQYVLGVALIVIATAATFVGAPFHYLVYAVAAPLAMLVVAVLMFRGVLAHEPRPRTAAAEG